MRRVGFVFGRRGQNYRSWKTQCTMILGNCGWFQGFQVDGQ